MKNNYSDFGKAVKKKLAKYGFYDESKPYNAKFMCCQCPIVENLKTNEEYKNHEFSLYRFCNMETECLNSIDLPDEINVVNDCL